MYEKAKEHQFPLDGLWTDIDYMDGYLDFTVDSTRYPNITDFIGRTLRDDHVHFIPILDAGIASSNNSIYNQGLEQDAYIRSGYTDEVLIGKVWPGRAAFVNLFPDTGGDQYWRDQL